MSPQKAINSQKLLSMISSQTTQSYKKRLSKPSTTRTRIILKSTFFNDTKPITNDAREKSIINTTLFHNDEESQPLINYKPESQSKSRTASNTILLARNQSQN